jgi:hypothetical protein
MSAVGQGEEGQVLVQVVVVGECVRVGKLDVGAEGVIEPDADDSVHLRVDGPESGAGADHTRRCGCGC